MLDLAAVVAPIGLFFGRIANFINGELWGRPHRICPWASSSPMAGPVPRHPSQLYEASPEGLLLFVGARHRGAALRLPPPGLLGGMFVFGYALARIFCEFFREPDRAARLLVRSVGRGARRRITMGMLLSLPMLIVGAVAIWLAARGARSRPPRRTRP